MLITTGSRLGIAIRSGMTAAEKSPFRTVSYASRHRTWKALRV